MELTNEQKKEKVRNLRPIDDGTDIAGTLSASSMGGLRVRLRADTVGGKDFHNVSSSFILLVL